MCYKDLCYVRVIQKGVGRISLAVTRDTNKTSRNTPESEAEFGKGLEVIHSVN